MSAPKTQGPLFARTTAVGPMAQLPLRDTSAVAVGKEKIGPTPQMTFRLRWGHEQLSLDISQAACRVPAGVRMLK